MKNTIPRELAETKLRQIELIIVGLKQQEELSYNEFQDLKYFVDSLEKKFKV